jgi:hypothetical protein
LFGPDQFAQIWPAVSTKTAFRSLRPAVPLKLLTATVAITLPATARHVSCPTTHWSGTKFDALPFPDRIVSVARTDQGVSDLVEDRVPNLFVAVALHEIHRKFDGAPVVSAKTQRLLPPIECKGPIG